MSAESAAVQAPSKEPPCIIRALADVPERALVTETGLAQIFGVTDRTIRRMVDRGELPPPVRLADTPTWMAGMILDHVQENMQRAMTEAHRITKIRRGA